MSLTLTLLNKLTKDAVGGTPSFHETERMDIGASKLRDPGCSMKTCLS